MADSFMIRFSSHGKPCYANVYVHGGNSHQFHVHLVNPHLCPGIPHELIFTGDGGNLHYTGTQDVPPETLREIGQAIQKIVT